MRIGLAVSYLIHLINGHETEHENILSEAFPTLQL
jgi:hypothetical protein